MDTTFPNLPVIANQQGRDRTGINDTHIPQQLTPQLLNGSRDLIRHSGVVLADCNRPPKPLSGLYYCR